MLFLLSVIFPTTIFNKKQSGMGPPRFPRTLFGSTLFTLKKRPRKTHQVSAISTRCDSHRWQIPDRWSHVGGCLTITAPCDSSSKITLAQFPFSGLTIIKKEWKWARPDLNWSHSVPNAIGWTMLPYGPMSLSNRNIVELFIVYLYYYPNNITQNNY